MISVTSLGLKFLRNMYAEGMFLRINHHEKDEVKDSHKMFTRYLSIENVLSSRERLFF